MKGADLREDAADAGSQLIDAYLDGTASESAIKVLQAKLLASPAFARELLALSYVECVARRPASEQQPASFEVDPRNPRRRWWLVVAACLVTVIALFACWWTDMFSPLREVRNSGSRARIFSFDFETATTTYPRWDRATLAACPPGRNGRRCLSAIRMALRRGQLGMTLGDWKQAFLTYAPGLRINFSAWAGESAAGNRYPMDIVFYVGNGEGAEAFVVRSELIGSTRWHKVSIPLSQAKGSHSQRSLRSTDRISAIHLTLAWSKNDVFVIDDFEIADVTGWR